MADEIKNPYVEKIDPNQEFLIGKKACWVVVGLFLLTIIIPPVYRNVKAVIDGDWVPVVGFFQYDPTNEKTPDLVHHLRAVEGKIDEAKFRKSAVRLLQRVMTPVLSEGNQKVFIGKDDWLFFKPAMKGLTGYGPLKPEPPSPMKDPTVKGWSPALPAIEKFSAQLKERGIDLVMVPLPVKPMIYPEMIDGKDHSGPVRHADSDALYAKLREAGVDVLDLSDTFWQRKQSGEQMFLKQDTHWTSDTMREAARLVAEHVKSKPYFEGLETNAEFDEQSAERGFVGDLVNKLELQDSELFQEEKQLVSIINDAATGMIVEDDTKSPVVLLGDSFVNVFDAPDIGFGDPNWRPKHENDREPLIGAGFRRHLARELGMTIDTIAINGGAASKVRQDFALRPDNQVREKKVVIWLLASRDLFLSETPAREEGVNWTDVEFNPNEEIEVPENGFVATAKLLEKSEHADPQKVTYPDAVFACLYEIESVEEGVYEKEQVLVYQWAFRKKELLPTSKFEVGKKYKLVLSPWDSKKTLQTVNKTTKPEWELRFDLLPLYYVESGSPVE